ncbi:hypothetical protein BJ912DRAFT_963222, partial [Pholiota molesta]
QGDFPFDEDEYLNTISGKYFSHTALAKEIYRKRAKRLSAKVHTGMGILAATLTGGAALVGTAIAGRNISVESQKLEMLEAEWARRGQPMLPKSKFKDKIIPITIAVGTSLFAVGIDIALSGASPDQFYHVGRGETSDDGSSSSKNNDYYEDDEDEKYDDDEDEDDGDYDSDYDEDEDEDYDRGRNSKRYDEY